MTTRFIAEFGRPGFMSHVVDQKQETKNGKGIIASCHSQHWAETIVVALNYCDTDHNDHAPIIPLFKKEQDHDT